MQYYLIYRVFGFFTKIPKIWIYALIIALIFPVVTIIDRFFYSTISTSIYYMSTIWLGITFLTICTLLIFEIVNIIHPIFSNKIFGLILIVVIFCLATFSIINANNTKIKELTISEFGSNLTIVQISDAHIGSIRGKAFLENIIKKTNNLNPDLVVITGDFFDGSGRVSSDTIQKLDDIKAPIYFIMGNHETYTGEKDIVSELNKTKVKILQNEVAIFKNIQIIGLNYSNSAEYVNKELNILKINKSKPSMLLNHEPRGYNYAKEKGIKLQLSGHTHGGQIFPFSIIVKAITPKYKGLYSMDNFSLYVSEGVGTWGPPMRLGTNSEITLIHLTK